MIVKIVQITSENRNITPLTMFKNPRLEDLFSDATKKVLQVTAVWTDWLHVRQNSRCGLKRWRSR